MDGGRAAGPKGGRSAGGFVHANTGFGTRVLGGSWLRFEERIAAWLIPFRPAQLSHIERVRDGTTKSNSPQDRDPEWLARWPLAGGPTVRFRPVRPEDQPLITEAIRTASRETLLHRFFSPIRSVSPDQLRRMLAIDGSREVCIVGVVTVDNTSQIICGARYVRLPKPGAAEIALTVHDDFQRRGLGAFLLQLLARRAVADGIAWFEADVMASNRKMLNLFTKLAPDHIRTRRMGDVIHLVFEPSKVVWSE